MSDSGFGGWNQTTVGGEDRAIYKQGLINMGSTLTCVLDQKPKVRMVVEHVCGWKHRVPLFFQALVLSTGGSVAFCGGTCFLGGLKGNQKETHFFLGGAQKEDTP